MMTFLIAIGATTAMLWVADFVLTRYAQAILTFIAIGEE